MQVRSPRPAVLRRLGAVLLDDLDVLSRRLVTAILRSEPGYDDGATVPEAELRTSVRVNLDRAIRQLAGELPVDGGPDDPARHTGVRRAQEGVPLESVLRAYRLGGQIIWDALVEAAQRTEGVDAHELMASASIVWALIDDHSAAMAEGYRAEEQRRRSWDEQQRQLALDALLEGRGGDPVFAREAARTLGVPVGAPVVCVVALADDGGSPCTPDGVCGASGFTSVWCERADAAVGLVSLEGRSLTALVTLLRDRAGGRVGVSPPVDGLAHVSTAHRLAELSARTIPTGEETVALLDDRLPEALLANSPEIVPRVLARTVDPLAELEPADRRALLATVAAALEHDGSPTRAAAALYCHRNTVTYRLQRIEELTGLGISSPRDRLLWMLALAAEPIAAVTRPERRADPASTSPADGGS